MFDPRTIGDIFPPHPSASVPSVRLPAIYARSACPFGGVDRLPKGGFCNDPLESPEGAGTVPRPTPPATESAEEDSLKTGRGAPVTTGHGLQVPPR
jgi:hypothetical protein